MWLTSLRARPCHSPWNTKKATKMFDYTAIADRLRTVSWRTGVVNQFTGPPLPFPVKHKDGHKKCSITQRLRTDLGRSVGELMWLTGLRARPCHSPWNKKMATKMFDYTAIADRLRTVSWRTDVVNRFTGPTLPVKSKGHERNQTKNKRSEHPPKRKR